MAQRKPAPHNIDEFIEFGWTDLIRYRIRAFRLNDILNREEDLVQDILISLMDTHYIDRYDNTRPFSTYVYGFIDNFLKKKYNKENTKNGKNIVNRATLEGSPKDDETQFDGHTVYLDLFKTDTLTEDTMEHMELIDAIRKDLEAFPATSSTVYNGVVYNRDPLTVFNLVLEDYSVIDIARMLDTSRQFVYHLLKKIRTSPTLSELRAEHNRHHKPSLE